MCLTDVMCVLPAELSSRQLLKLTQDFHSQGFLSRDFHLVKFNSNLKAKVDFDDHVSCDQSWSWLTAVESGPRSFSCGPNGRAPIFVQSQSVFSPEININDFLTIFVSLKNLKDINIQF